ncbi:SCO1664 family protein [Pseudonocardiaceae bacterium YIM PH 21723]|nr:SCO1664 family protein [Pseudonocardiaceae bacterium YIM PH 21723]
MGMGEDEALDLLRQGELEIQGRLVDASNATLYCALALGELTAECVYKPVRGERPLWDFPDGTLAGRELAAYLISRAAGLSLVPPTVLRDGPAGPGMAQLWIDTDPENDLVRVTSPDTVPDGWRVILHAVDNQGNPAVLAHADDPDLQLLAVLDIVLNNADRKGGHVLRATDGSVYGIDHGICLNAEDKLRTVLWGWLDEPLPERALTMLAALAEQLDDALGTELAEHLTQDELTALRGRIEQLQRAGVFPKPAPGWPPIPWPVF